MKKLLIIGLGLVIAGGLIGYNMYNKPKDNIEDLDTDVSITAQALVSEYALDEAQADKDYLGKVVQVEGEIQEVETGEFTVITLKGDDIANVRAQLVASVDTKLYENKKKITIKGKCAGVLLDVTLNDCIILK